MNRLPLCILILYCAALLAQNPEAGHIEHYGDRSTLIVDSPRPVDSAAITVAETYGIRINVEDPPYLYKDDILTLVEQISLHSATHVIPRGGRLEVSFPSDAEGHPLDVPGLIQKLVDAANAQFPFHYHFDADGNWYTILPGRTRDLSGQSIEITPLLDRHVTIPLGTRSIAASAGLMADALSQQTGIRVSCCQGAVAGIPWGLSEVGFEAHGEPARFVFKRLIRLAAGNHPARQFWVERCDPAPSNWCVINLLNSGPDAHVRAGSSGPAVR